MRVSFFQFFSVVTLAITHIALLLINAASNSFLLLPRAGQETETGRRHIQLPILFCCYRCAVLDANLKYNIFQFFSVVTASTTVSCHVV